MIATTDMSLRSLVDLARQQSAHHLSTGFGPIPLNLAGESENQLSSLAEPLAESLGAGWPSLDVVVATAATIAPDRIPPAIRPQGSELVVARDGGTTALANGADGTLWLLDELRSTAVLWVEDFDALPLWEHTSPLRGAARWWSTLHGYAMVHAGAVADADRCVLLVGDSGAGKSTTTLACHGSGLDILGDDFCLLEPATATNAPIAHTMYRLAKLDERALEMLPHLRSRVVGTAWRGKKLIDLVSTATLPRRVVAVCHVVHDGSSATHVEPISRVEALRAVAPSTIFQQRLWEHETWNVLSTTVRATQCYRLTVNGIDEVPDMIHSVLDASPASNME